MKLHLSMNSLKSKEFRLFFQSGFSIALLMSLASCSVFKSNDYAVKDSLYVWSDSFDETAEVSEAESENQTIHSQEDSIVKNDVELIFDDMVTNQIAEIDLKLAEINLKLAEIDSKTVPLKNTVTQTSPVATVTSVAAAASEATPNLVTTAHLTPAPALTTTPALTTALKNEKRLQQPEIVLTKVPIKQNTPPEAETTLVAQNSQEEIQTVEDINRVTKEAPTAAGIPIDKVLSNVKTEVAVIEVPKEILRSAVPAAYPSGLNEYGMWQVAKSKDSLYQEVCSLYSATMQLEVENYYTQVWLKVVGNNLLVNSTTNIDIAKPSVGIQFDNNALQAFNKNHFQTSAVWSGDLETALKNNKQLSISLSGNELGRRTQEVSIGLNDLKKAYSEYRKCNQGTQIGSL